MKKSNVYNSLLSYRELENSDDDKTHDASIVTRSFERYCEKVYGEKHGYLVLCAEPDINGFSSAHLILDAKDVVNIAAAAVGEMALELEAQKNKRALFYKNQPITDVRGLLWVLYELYAQHPVSSPELRDRFLKGEL